MDIDDDMGRFGVESVLDEFFDDGCGSLDDFTCFESIDDDIGEYFDGHRGSYGL